MIKICIWMNIPSHHQSTFFSAIARDSGFDLQVRYFRGLREDRKKEGWIEVSLHGYEKILPDPFLPEQMIADALPDWRERIHILSLRSHPGVSGFLRRNRALWCQWSERPGYGLFTLVNGCLPAWRVMNWFYLVFWKRRDGRIIESEAMHAFVAGLPARRYYERIGVSEKKISDLYYAIQAHDGRASTEILEFAAGRGVFLFVGSLSTWKGVDLLLKAFARLRCSAEWCLVLCGYDKSGGALERKAAGLGLSEHDVLFAGAVPSDEIDSFYHAADVTILPSRFDGWGMPLLEAAAAGCALIGSDMAGASSAVIEPGRNGFAVRAGSARALREAMRYYVADPEAAKRHGEASRDIYLARLTPECNVRRLAEGLKNALINAQEK